MKVTLQRRWMFALRHACLSWITDGKICCLDRGLVDFPGIHGGR